MKARHLSVELLNLKGLGEGPAAAEATVLPGKHQVKLQEVAQVHLFEANLNWQPRREAVASRVSCQRRQRSSRSQDDLAPLPNSLLGQLKAPAVYRILHLIIAERPVKEDCDFHSGHLSFCLSH